MENRKIGIIGCGNISAVYLKNLREQFEGVEVCAVCDTNRVLAERAAETYHIPYVYDNADELCKNPEIRTIVVLTTPGTHAELCKKALLAGKNAYCEKPLGTDLKAAAEVVQIAREKGLHIGCAPDTYLGAAIQTGHKLIKDGWIGLPIGARCNVIMFGPETWHPNPAFFYKKGAGPVLDWGPYYISALAYLLGPVRRVSSVAKKTYGIRKMTCKERYGQEIEVEVPTYISGILEHESGTVSTIIITFDACSEAILDMEIMGTDGTLVIPNPDTFGAGKMVRYKRLERIHHDLEKNEWFEIPYLFGNSDNSRGLGLVDMLNAIEEKRLHCANGDFAYHVLEVMLALEQPGDGSAVEIQSRF